MTEIFDDIRKLYKFRVPRMELQPYIEFFSESSAEATAKYITTDSFTVRLFQSFTPTFWINLGDAYQIDNGMETRNIGRTADVLILRSTTVDRKVFSTDKIFTLKFNPLGFETIFGVSQAKIGHRVVDPVEVLGASMIRMLKEPSSLDDKVAFIERLLLEKLHKNTKDTRHLTCLMRTIDLFVDSKMEIRISKLASQINVSEKTFCRYFHQIMGTSPKEFFSMTRCRIALTQYKRDPKQFSPYDHGYYDFGHFSKDVKRFTGSNLTSFC